MSNKNEINILIANDPLPLSFVMSKKWPSDTKVNFIKTEYTNYKPEPIKLPKSQIKYDDPIEESTRSRSQTVNISSIR